jgi:putative transposase
VSVKPGDAQVGVTRRRRRGCTVGNPTAEPSDDLVQRWFSAEAHDQLWVADITQQRTAEGSVDACSRRVIGWSIADHLRTELVVDALEMALWRRRPTPGETIHHADHGTQHTPWACGQRLRHTGVLGSMGTIGDCFDNALAESFFATVETELLDRSTWPTRARLAAALFDYIERFYDPPAVTPASATSAPSTTRPHSPSPPAPRHDHNQPVRETGGTPVKPPTCSPRGW